MGSSKTVKSKDKILVFFIVNFFNIVYLYILVLIASILCKI